MLFDPVCLCQSMLSDDMVRRLSFLHGSASEAGVLNAILRKRNWSKLSNETEKPYSNGRPCSTRWIHAAPGNHI